MSNEVIQHLSTVMPSDTMKLGNAPANMFMPKAENLITMKAERVNQELPALPKLIQRPQYDLWFKQDDTFEQPLIKINCKIYTNSSNFPYSIDSIVLAMLWQKLVSEHVREMDYVADLAGISAQFSVSTDFINFSYVSYNDKMEEYFA